MDVKEDLEKQIEILKLRLELAELGKRIAELEATQPFTITNGSPSITEPFINDAQITSIPFDTWFNGVAAQTRIHI